VNSKYRIAVDASSLAEPMTGVGRYTYEILRRLVVMGHEWVLYAHRPLVVGDWDQPNVSVVAGRVPRRLLRTFWVQTAVPYMARRDRAELFWSPAHRLPIVLPDNVARVVTIHDLVWKRVPETMHPFSYWLDKTLMPVSVRLADRVITVSQHTAGDVLAEMPLTGDKLRPIPLGISDLSQPGPRGRLNSLGLSEPYFLFVGTLEPRKNLARLLEGYSRLPGELKDRAMLAVAGGKGWGGIDVMTLADNFGIRDRIKVLGYVDDAVLATLYAHALFFAMPSLYEGFGLPLLEAMARGSPVLTSTCASMPEVAGDAGLFVDPNDVESIRQGLVRLLGDDSLRNALASKAQANAFRFSWDRAAEETLEVFEEAITARRPLLP